MKKAFIYKLVVRRGNDAEDIFEVGYQSPYSEDIITLIDAKRYGNHNLKFTIVSGNKRLCDVENYPVIIHWKDGEEED